MKRLKALLVGFLSTLLPVSSAAAATLTATVPSAYSDGIDFGTVTTVLGVIGGSVIAVYLAVKLLRWILLTFM